MTKRSRFWDGTVHLVETANLDGTEPWEKEARDLFSVQARLIRRNGKYDVHVSFRSESRRGVRKLEIDYGDLVELLEGFMVHGESLLVIVPNWGDCWQRLDIESCFLLIDLAQRLQQAFPSANVKFLFVMGTVSIPRNIQLVT
jgi:hypothetical protein